MVVGDRLEVSTRANRAAWRAYVRQVHARREIALRRRARAALRAQRAALVDSLDALPVKWWGGAVHRDLLGDVLSALFGVDLDTLMGDEVRDALRAALRAGFRYGADGIGRPALQWLTPRVDATTDAQLGQLVTRTSQGTRDRVGALARLVLDEGGTIADLQARIQTDLGFGPMRSLRIARTETTRAVDAGSRAAWQDVADNEGVIVRRQWLAELDGATREAHRLLSGQERGIAEAFEVPSGDYAGAKGMGPGSFASAALVVNCRCTTIPVVVDP